jgi:hypothetical protein
MTFFAQCKAAWLLDLVICHSHGGLYSKKSPLNEHEGNAPPCHRDFLSIDSSIWLAVVMGESVRSDIHQLFLVSTFQYCYRAASPKACYIRTDGTGAPDKFPPPVILLFGADLHRPMSTTAPSATGNVSGTPISLLSLGENTLIVIMNGMLKVGIDAGGPQGISQLLILRDVVERISKDDTGDSQGILKRPCEVFDMICGVGTGGSVWFTFTFEIRVYLL